MADEGKTMLAPAGYLTEVAIAFENAAGVSEVVDPMHRLPIDTVAQATATDRGALVGTTAVQLMPANTARRAIAVQNQSATATVYLSGVATATADYHSLMLAPGALYESADTHVGTGAISVIATAANTPVYAREV